MSDKLRFKGVRHFRFLTKHNNTKQTERQPETQRITKWSVNGTVHTYTVYTHSQYTVFLSRPSQIAVSTTNKLRMRSTVLCLLQPEAYPVVCTVNRDIFGQPNFPTKPKKILFRTVKFPGQRRKCPNPVQNFPIYTYSTQLNSLRWPLSLWCAKRYDYAYNTVRQTLN